MAIKIVIDSAADIGSKEAEELGIIMIPMIINFGDEEYYDGVDLLPNQFYEKLTTCKVLPKTSQVTPFRFEEAFEKIINDGDEVLVIVLSSKLSGTCAAAKQAAGKFGDKVRVVDSLSAAIGERLLCMRALEMIKEGYSLQDIYNELNTLKNKLVVRAVLDTLEYLKKGGRISGAVAFVGGMLNIKPVVGLLDGEVKMIGKARGQKKGAEFLYDIIKESDIDFSLPVGALYSGADNSFIRNFLENNKESLGNKNVNTYVLGSTIGTHVGPGGFGIAYFTK